MRSGCVETFNYEAVPKKREELKSPHEMCHDLTPVIGGQQSQGFEWSVRWWRVEWRN